MTRLGYQIPNFTYPSTRPEEIFDKVVAQAKTAEAAGHDRLIGFAVVNPYGPDGGAPELRRAVTEWGMKGLKLMPLRHGYEVDGRTAWKVMESASELGVPVSIHSGAQFCLPWQIASLARLFPTVPVIMDHMGWRYYVDGATRSSSSG